MVRSVHLDEIKIRDEYFFQNENIYFHKFIN